MYCKGACSGNIGCDLPPGAQAAVVGSSFLERVGNPPARWVGSPRGLCAQISFQRPGSAGPCAHSPGRADGCPSLALLRKIGEARPTSWLNFKLHWELGLCCAAMSGGTVRSLGKGEFPICEQGQSHHQFQLPLICPSGLVNSHMKNVNRGIHAHAYQPDHLFPTHALHFRLSAKRKKKKLPKAPQNTQNA